MKSEVVIAFLLGAVVALSSAVAVMAFSPSYAARPAFAAEGGQGELFGMLGQGYQGQSRDTLFVVDSQSKRLLVYDYNNATLNLSAVRNLKWDLRFEEFTAKGAQKPSVAEQRRKIKAQERARDE